MLKPIREKEKLSNIIYLHILCWLVYSLYSAAVVYQTNDPTSFEWTYENLFMLNRVFTFYFQIFFISKYYLKSNSISKYLNIIGLQLISLIISIVFDLVISSYYYYSHHFFQGQPTLNDILKDILFDYFSFNAYGLAYVIFRRLNLTKIQKLNEINLYYNNESKLIQQRFKGNYFSQILTKFDKIDTNIPAGLKKSMSSLAELTNYISDNDETRFVTLNEEIEQIKKYILLNQNRFSQKLLIDFEIIEPIHNIKIPSLILLTLVENAFKHGNLKRESLNIQLKTVDENISFVIKNLKNNTQNVNSTKLGIENIKKRLFIFYKNAYEFIINETPTHFEVQLKLNQA